MFNMGLLKIALLCNKGSLPLIHQINNQIMRKYFFVVFVIISVFVSCAESDDLSDVQILSQDIYDKMSLKYYWAESMPDLDPLKQESPSEYFYSLLDDVDDWSYISNSYVDLVALLSGSSEEIGYSIQLYVLSDASSYIAYVEYVYPDSPADEAGIKRGDIIARVNGQSITEDNADELYGSVVELNLATVSGTTLNVSSTSISIDAEVLYVNPILATNVFDEGGTKVGYIAYTSFLSDYDDELADVFADFQSQGVEELILDLRYNNGGEVSSALSLASMIVPQSDVGKTFVKYTYNSSIQENVTDEDVTLTFEESSNNLNLSRVFVLTTESTASASEMVMYGLSPYMEVIQIGAETVGKYYTSSIIAIEYGWAILPIMAQMENSDNSIDYDNGLMPDYTMSDDYDYPLGSENDALTQKALSIISGNTTTSKKSVYDNKYRVSGRIRKNSLTNVMF